MNTMSLTTPALLFPAISLLMLAYTNRFLTIAQLVRQLAREVQPDSHVIRGQIANLHKRLALIKYMQMIGVFSFLLCALSMFALFMNALIVGEILFGASLLCLTGSLFLSLYELSISTHALNLLLENIDQEYQNGH